MKARSLRLAYFSPTGGTRAVVRSIADGIKLEILESLDVTTPRARRQSLEVSEHDVLVVAVPVYMGRVPDLLNDWLNAIHAHNTPTVCVVVYGNRAFEDSLVELRDIVVKRGCIPIAGAAYIAEHSFSNPEEPIARGRPDEGDLKHAYAFGRRVREKLRSTPSVFRSGDVDMPGRYPYGGTTQLWNVDFIEVSTECRHCGVCARVCPVGAVDSRNSALVDHGKCITCCACIKSCPQNARTMKPGPVKDAARRLNALCEAPKEPQCFM